jgi:hypothetical protein
MLADSIYWQVLPIKTFPANDPPPAAGSTPTSFRMAQNHIIDSPGADAAGYQVMILQRPKRPAAKPGTMSQSR